MIDEISSSFFAVDIWRSYSTNSTICPAAFTKIFERVTKAVNLFTRVSTNLINTRRRRRKRTRKKLDRGKVFFCSGSVEKDRSVPQPLHNKTDAAIRIDKPSISIISKTARSSFCSSSSSLQSCRCFFCLLERNREERNSHHSATNIGRPVDESRRRFLSSGQSLGNVSSGDENLSKRFEFCD